MDRKLIDRFSNLKTNKYARIARRSMRIWFRRKLYAFSPVLLYRYLFIRKMGRLPRLRNPQIFDEKIAWLMFHRQQALKIQCADKYGMRSYVQQLNLAHFMPELFGVYENSNEIDFDSLPNKFVLKCTHGCSFNIFCRNKAELDVEETKYTLDMWMKIDFGEIYGEVHYSLIKPRIICEEYLDDLKGDLPNDYKLYCFDGKVHCTMACTERDFHGHGAKYDIYDREWKNKLPYSRSSLLANREISRPENYEEMVYLAEVLSKPFTFVRVDFYNINGKIIIGEMTFTPSGCVDPGYTNAGQLMLGEKIKLSKDLPYEKLGRTGIFMILLSKLFSLVCVPICRAYARHVLVDKPADIFMCFAGGIYFWITHMYWPHFKNPRSFSEKVWHRMLFNRDKQLVMLSDKLQVRDFVARNAGSNYLIPMLCSAKQPEDIRFEDLPSEFVIKATHGCKYNIFVHDKTKLNEKEVRLQLKQWLSENYCQAHFLGIEWAYKNVEPNIIIESFIGSNGSVPVDYKFFCFSGRVEFIQVSFDRFTNASERILDRDFNSLGVWNGLKLYSGEIARPDNYEEMIGVAESLAGALDFIRVDLYNVGGRIYFGEMTCYPAAGLARFLPKEYDFLFGEKWKIK